MSDNGPLAGIRVLDLTRILAGPLCTMMLGDMGADVIKVEPPETGDDTRAWGPPFLAGDAVYFLGVNRSKRSLTLNMAVPAGQKILAGLIAKADVLIDNFRLGTLEKWGFADAWFERHAPRLVRCSITGYGSSGPKASLPGYDFILQAESGLMSICGEPDGRPTKYGVAIVDVCTGMLASNSILAALHARELALVSHSKRDHGVGGLIGRIRHDAGMAIAEAGGIAAGGEIARCHVDEHRQRCFVKREFDLLALAAALAGMERRKDRV